MAPPENAIVICVDEKPSIQALERAQGYLKLPNGRALTGHSHEIGGQRALIHSRPRAQEPPGRKRIFLAGDGRACGREDLPTSRPMKRAETGTGQAKLLKARGL